MKKVIAVDMNNVLVDIEVQMPDWYEREFGIRINREAMAGVAEDAAFSDPAAAIKTVLLLRSLFNITLIFC